MKFLRNTIRLSPRLQRRLVRCCRILLACFAGLCLLAAIGFWAVTRSWFIVWQITPELQRKLGGDVTIGQAAYQGDGRVIFKDVKLRARGIPGEAGEVARIGDAIVTLDLRNLFRTGVRISAIDVDHAVLRFSEDLYESGQLNVWSLTPDWSQRSGQAMPPPPRVRIQNAAIEFGWHDKDHFERLGRRLVSGEMYPIAGTTDLYNFELGEIDQNGSGLMGGVRMKGDWNAATNEWSSRIDDLELDDRIYRMCPQVVRAFWRQMDLKGRVHSVQASGGPDIGFAMTLVIEDVALTLPVQTTLNWARYKDGHIEESTSRPRMHFSGGEIKLTGRSFELNDLTGVLGSSSRYDKVVGVPYRINFSIPDLPPIVWNQREQWMERVLKYAPFRLKYTTEDLRLVRLEGEEPPAVDLPQFVANVLDKFRITDWVLTTTLDVSRAGPVVNAAGDLIDVPPVVAGNAYLHHASGRYQKFPYRLDDVDAYLQFDSDKVVVHYLTGRGSGESKLRLWGEISPLGPDAAVSLHLRGTDVPVDDRLREALHGSELEAYDMMFNRAAATSLASAGLLPDQHAIDAAKVKLADARTQLTALRANAAAGDAANQAQIDALEADVKRLQHFVDAGPFQLGGTINLDLQIERERGDDRPTITTGAIDIQHVGLLYEKFPYPLRISGGRLQWMKDRVVIDTSSGGEGLSVVTPGGGRGVVTGELVLPQPHAAVHKFAPNLSIQVEDDAINDAVYAAIPLTRREKTDLGVQPAAPGATLSQAARFLQGLGLKGAASYQGRITTDDDHHVNYDFALTLDNATATPTADLARTVGASREIWPPNYTLHDIAGTLRVTRDQIAVDNLIGLSDEGSLAVNGQIDLSDGQLHSSITAAFKNLPIAPYLLNLAPESQSTDARAVWDRYEPEGSFDATLLYDSTPESPISIAVNIEPQRVSVTLGERRVTMNYGGGDLHYQGGDLDLRGLRLALFNDKDIEEGVVSLNGRCNFSPGHELFDIRGEVEGGRLESTTLAYLIQQFAGQPTTDQFMQCQPVGQFDGEFEVHAAANQPPDWAFQVTPHATGLHLNGRPILATFDQGTIAVDPHRIVIRDVRGRHAEGEFQVDGEITIVDPVQADVRLGYSGQVRSDLLEAILPPAAMRTLDQIKFVDAGPTVVTNGKLHLSRIEQPDHTAAWGVSFQGPIHTSAATFEAGVEFSDISGDFNLDLKQEPGQPLSLNIVCAADVARAVGQDLRDIEAVIRLEDEGAVLRMPTFRATAEDGVITARAWMRTDSRREYQAVVDMVDVPLNRFSIKPGESSNADQPAESDRPDAHRANGEVFGSFSVSGFADDPSTRRGRGVVRVVHGKMMNVPLLMQLMQVVQLSMPTGGSLDFADAQMYFLGDRIVFEHILFESTVGTSTTLQLLGEGEMNFKTLELTARFRSRGALPIVRDIMGEIGDRLYCIEISGPLSNPKARIVPLPDVN